MSSLAIIALGSNLGDRLAHLQAARAALQGIAVAGTWQQSSIYQTEPVACPDDSPDFFNAVVSFAFEGSAEELHRHTAALETELGRERSVVNAPRTIDIDLLALGQHVIDTPTLQIPHPRLHLRRFVLEPLVEIHPTLHLPQLPHRMVDLLDQLSSQEPALQKVSSCW